MGPVCQLVEDPLELDDFLGRKRRQVLCQQFHVAVVVGTGAKWSYGLAVDSKPAPVGCRSRWPTLVECDGWRRPARDEFRPMGGTGRL